VFEQKNTLLDDDDDNDNDGIHKLSWIRAAELVKTRIIVAQTLEREF